MTDVHDSDKDAVSTLVLLGDKEYVLRASRGRVVFNNYSRGEPSFEQAITVVLHSGHEPNADTTSSTESAAVPIILSTPSTNRFEVHQVSSPSSPLECLLSLGSPNTIIVKFKLPEASENDFVWDNFQDQLVIHTRLSKLEIPLEAWKYDAPTALSYDGDNTLLFPASLPDVKAPPLRRFGAIERNADHRMPSPHHADPTNFAATSKPEYDNMINTRTSPNSQTPRTPRSEILPPLLRPTSSDQQSSSFVSPRPTPVESSLENAAQLSAPTVTAVQSQREAYEVILKLRRRRTSRNKSKIPGGVSPALVIDRELFPETLALDANTKAELEGFNNLVASARDHVAKQDAKAKSELAYYQQLLPTPPPHDSSTDMPAVTTAQKPRKPRHLSAARRPSKLPSLARPSFGEVISSAPNTSVNNQQASPLAQRPVRRRVSGVKTAKLQSLQRLTGNLRRKEPSKSLVHDKLGSTTNQQQQELQDTDSELIDFDDPDPQVDEAPVLPDDLSGVATLEADELYL